MATKSATQKKQNGNYEDTKIPDAPLANTPAQSPDIEDDGPPAGYEDGSTPDLAGWYKPELGTSIQGQIIGHIVVVNPKNHQKRDVCLVQLEKPAMAVLKGNEEVSLDAGEVLGVGVSYDLRKMLQYVENKGSIWIRPKEKKVLSGGNSLWKFEQYYKGVKAPLRSQEAGTNPADDDDIPF